MTKDEEYLIRQRTLKEYHQNEITKSHKVQTIILLLFLIVLMCSLILAAVAQFPTEEGKFLSTGLFRDTAFFVVITALIGAIMQWNFINYQNRVETQLKEMDRWNKEIFSYLITGMKKMQGEDPDSAPKKDDPKPINESQTKTS